MKILSFVAILFTSQFSFADNCDDFKRGVAVEAISKAVSFKAGDEISIPVKIAIDKNEAKKWKFISMSAGVFNGIIGSKSLTDTYSLKNQNALEIPDTLSFRSSENMGGDYKLGLFIYAQDKSYPRVCSVNLEEIPNLKIEITNASGKIDINPPTAKSIRFKKDSYRAGDTLEVLFQATTKNEVCTVWKSQNSKCEVGTHVELQATDNSSTVSFHTPTPIFKTKNQETLLAVIPLSEEYATTEVKPGRYRLTHFMFKDLYGNFFDKVPEGTDVLVEFK